MGESRRTLPGFTPEGFLPAGDYELTFAQLPESLLVVGPDDKEAYPNWDTRWRRRLAEQLEILVRELWKVGISEIFIDGSFVEDKDHPNDIDGYFECNLARLASGELQRELNLLDPHKAWTWEPTSRRPYHGYPKKQLPMWHVYRVEFYPHVGQLSGIRDQHGHELEFPSAFRRSRRDGQPRARIIHGSIRKRRNPFLFRWLRESRKKQCANQPACASVRFSRNRGLAPIG